MPCSRRRQTQRPLRVIGVEHVTMRTLWPSRMLAIKMVDEPLRTRIRNYTTVKRIVIFYWPGYWQLRRKENGVDLKLLDVVIVHFELEIGNWKSTSKWTFELIKQRQSFESASPPFCNALRGAETDSWLENFSRHSVAAVPQVSREREREGGNVAGKQDIRPYRRK